jgi:hypothetical protein
MAVDFISPPAAEDEDPTESEALLELEEEGPANSEPAPQMGAFRKRREHKDVTRGGGAIPEAAGQA